MLIKTLPVGELQANCYIIADSSGKAGVIDPGDELDVILKAIRENNFSVSAIVCTHGHFDHVGAAEMLKKATGAPLMMNSGDVFMVDWKPDRSPEEGDTVEFGTLAFTVLHTPGHSPGGICLLADNVVFTGDTLFADGVGRTDLPGGSEAELLKSIRQKLLTLDGSIVVYPGHGKTTKVGAVTYFS